MDECHRKSNEDICPEQMLCPSGSIAEVLKSVARSESWSLHRFFLQTSLFCEEDQKSQSASPLLGCEAEDRWCLNDAVDGLQEEKFDMRSKSKYINSSVPLYQEYWLKCMKAELQKGYQKKIANLVMVQQHASQTSPPSLRLSPASVTSAPSPPGLQVTPYALWQDLPEVRQQNLLDTLPTRDIQLQEAMFELIVSEASYQKSLRVAVGLFQCSAELKQTLTSVENHTLFSNLKEVCRTSEGFLLDLETRLGQNVVMSEVGDVVLSHQSAFRQVYVPYITNMMYQETLIAKQLQENRKFVVVLKKLEKDPLCQRQTLKSFLILPFQRITRLRLILENILKRTPEHSPYVAKLKEAIEAVRKIVVECDDRVQQMKQTEELVALGKILDFGSVKSIPVIVSGRHLIRDGPFKKYAVKKTHFNSMVFKTDVHLHLFNDHLLLSVKNGNRFSVQDHAMFPAHVKVEELKTTVLGLPSDAFLLHITQNHSGAATAVILAAQQRLERDIWLKLLSSH